MLLLRQDVVHKSSVQLRSLTSKVQPLAMASRALAACLLIATLAQTSSARPSTSKVFAAQLKDASGQQAFCDHFSSICSRICKRKKEQVTDLRCAPQSVKLSGTQTELDRSRADISSRLRLPMLDGRPHKADPDNRSERIQAGH